MENNNKELWKKERLKYNLKWPYENVVRFLHYVTSKNDEVRILDFGCGSGRNTRVMVEMGLDICAMDYNLACIELTKEKLGDYKKVDYVVNEELCVMAAENEFNVVVANGVLFYLNRYNEQKLLRELSRVLNMGGMLYADYRSKADEFYGRGKEIEPDLYELDETCGSLAGIQYAFRDAEEIKELYLRNGFEITNFERIDHYIENCTKNNSHYIVWAKKVRAV